MNDISLIFVIFGAMGVSAIVLIIMISFLVSRLADATTWPSDHSPQDLIAIRPLFQRLADDGRGGDLLPGTMYELPYLKFIYQGSPVIVTPQHVTSQLSRQVVQIGVRFTWPDGDFRLEVYPDGLLAQFRKLIGMGDLEVGDPLFDRKYMITTNHPDRAWAFLTPDVRQLITIARGQRYNDDIYLHVVGGTLLLQKRNITPDYQGISSFILLAQSIYDAALRMPLEGIEFIEEVVVDPASPVCQVCGEAIETAEVMCIACGTPHHRECWHYYGSCSVYGCCESKFQPYDILPARRI